MERTESFGSRLRQVMEARGLTYAQLGERLGMNPQTLNRYALDQREPKTGTATAIALALGVDPLWLQGYGSRGADAAGEGEVLVPIVGTIRAGGPSLALEDVTGRAPARVSGPEEHFYLRVSGDSMVNAGIRPGDLVLIRRQETAENGQIVACMVNGEDATLKRFRRRGDVVVLQPENPAYEPFIVSAREFETGAARIIGVAVRLTREL